MALTMGQLQKLLAQSGATGRRTEGVAAQLAADALLRSVARQAIIAAAADAVGQLAGNSCGLAAQLPSQVLLSRPGGGVDDPPSKGGDDGGDDGPN